jgi:ABC-type nitrate/sulfonate/bicarbonate transport system permease component
MKIRLISLAVVLIGWWIASLFGSDLTVPSPFLVISNFIELVVSGRLPAALALSLSALAIGGVLSVVIGIPLGILMGVRPSLGHAFDHYFSALYVMPMSAIIPLMVLWFGFDLSARVIFIFIFTVPQIVITCYQGAKNTPTTLIEVARAFRATERQIFWKVIIPYEVPYIITALRLGVGRAVQGMVVAELLLAGTRGVGFLIQIYSASLNLSTVLAIILFLMLLGILFTGIVRRFEEAIAPWRKGMVAETEIGNV